MSLKEEMRRKYEKHSSMAFYENNSGFEEGLLEKIINLAYANLSPYSSKSWNIAAVKSPVLLQRLYKIINDIRIVESATALIICDGYENSEKSVNNHELALLALAIGYAAKYYCIDYFLIKTFDEDLIVREFALDRKLPVEAVICLGYFKDSAMQCIPHIKNQFSNTVRFL